MAEEIEQLEARLTREWLENRRIVVFTLHDTTRQGVDVWIAALKQTVYSWPRERVYLALYDLTDKNVTYTPYLRAESDAFTKEVLRKIPNARGYVAIALPGAGFAHLLRLFLMQSVVRRYKGVEHQLFPTREQGLAWLREHLS